MKPLFISFEGIEGCGKSTQAKKLHEFFLANNISAILTREPGGTNVGEKIREILIDEKIFEANPVQDIETLKKLKSAKDFELCSSGNNSKPSKLSGTPNLNKLEAKTELLLNFAARLEHVEKLIKPALQAGKIVICDRFFDSTYAYQGNALGLDHKLIDKIRKMTIGDFEPDVTFLIDVPVSLAFKRIEGRSQNNRYEKLGFDFHQKVRDGFLNLANNNPRIEKIDGSKNSQEISTKIHFHKRLSFVS